MSFGTCQICQKDMPSGSCLNKYKNYQPLFHVACLKSNGNKIDEIAKKEKENATATLLALKNTPIKISRCLVIEILKKNIVLLKIEYQSNGDKK